MHFCLFKKLGTQFLIHIVLNVKQCLDMDMGQQMDNSLDCLGSADYKIFKLLCKKNDQYHVPFDMRVSENGI